MPDVAAGHTKSWIPEAPTRPLRQVLLLANPHLHFADAARALLAALVEAERFFVAGGVELSTIRSVLADDDIVASIALPGVTLAKAPAFQTVVDALPGRVRGSYRRTTDQHRLTEMLREVLDVPPDTHLQLVTDFEITPPPEWRYIIWDEVQNGTVIAIPPTDPDYWQVRDEHRVATVKHRVRTSCISSLGEWLGLTRCDKLACLMYANVDAAVRLDSMRRLGPEHAELPKLHYCGYAPSPETPSAVQDLEDMSPVTSPGGGGSSFRFKDGKFDPRVYLKAPEPDLEDL